MRKARLARLGAAAALVSGAFVFGTTALATSSAGAAAPYNCSGGTPTTPTLIPAGNYGPVSVTGHCYMHGTYSIRGGLTIAPGASLDGAVFFGTEIGPPYSYGTPCDVFANVTGGISVGAGAVLYWGNGADTGCPSSNGVVNGGITSTGGDTVVVHGTTINGGFSANGGGGAGNCLPTAAAPFGSYTNIETSNINGSVSVIGVTTCWIGLIQNVNNGLVTVNNNETSDTDAIEIGLNTIHGGLACSGNFLNPSVPPVLGANNGLPSNSFDGSPPNPNSVTGSETGQCAGL
jgi:hypothetical protein